ncbi:MAG: diguanylate cyclase [Deltaproteobacteria bacterium]|nr:diguanylate cyclase [Deltaproteobacteria bacterium]
MAYRTLAQNMKKKKSVIHNILLVGLSQTLLKTIKPDLEKQDFIIHQENNLQNAIRLIPKLDICLVLFDQDTYASESIEFVKQCADVITHPSVVVMTENQSIENIRSLFRTKVHDCLVKPFKLSFLLDSIKRGLAHRKSQIYGIKDPLTGLYNRYAFKEILRQEIDRAQRYERHLSLLMIDIDYFKRVNDLFGHLIGDEVLEEVADVIKSDWDFKLSHARPQK